MKYSVKTIATLLLTCIFFIPLLHANNEEYAVIFVHRLKKSTNSGTTFELLFNDETIGTFKGINTVFSTQAKDDWIVAKRLPGKFMLRIMEGSQTTGEIAINAKAGKHYFIEFDPSAAYGYKSVKLLSQKEGIEQVQGADPKNMQYAQSDLRQVVRDIQTNTLASDQENAVIFIHRLKKSTNSGTTYKVFFNNDKIGKFKGVFKAVSTKSKEDWIVTKYPPGPFLLRLVENKGNEEKETLQINAKSGHYYFVEFDPSAAYGYKSLKLLSQKAGYQQVIDTDVDKMQLTHDELKSVVSSIDYESMLALSSDNETQQKTAKQSKKTAKQTPTEKTHTSQENQPKDQASGTETETSTFVADIGKNIPEHNINKPYRFALIIGNEDYSSYQTDLSAEVNVAYARRDAKLFKEYAQSVLGIPEKNIIFELDADAVTMKRAVNKLKLVIKNTQGKADVFVYYAGHGLPHEQTKAPYLMPVNVSGGDLQFAVSLKELYKSLRKYDSKRITVFLDACFSGGARNQGLVAARGVKIKPRKNTLDGNIIVFSASSGAQSSLPYEEKQHGLFTYYLLKKIQETKGNLNYGELGNYLKEKVGIQSVLINNKEQNPQINISRALKDSWKNIQLTE